MLSFLSIVFDNLAHTRINPSSDKTLLCSALVLHQPPTTNQQTIRKQTTRVLQMLTYCARAKMPMAAAFTPVHSKGMVLFWLCRFDSMFPSNSYSRRKLPFSPMYALSHLSTTKQWCMPPHVPYTVPLKAATGDCRLLVES